MSTSIRKQLRNNPDKLLESLTENIQSTDGQALVRSKVDAISKVLVIENDKLAQRQQLSRKIGVARKANEDSSQLIAEVSQLSKEIDELKQTIDDNINAIELEIARNTSTQSNAERVSQPLHLQAPVSSAPTAGDTAKFTTSHDQPDQSEWQNFVDNFERSTIYHDPKWKSVIESYFRHSYHLISCRDHQGALVGILPLVHVSSRVFGAFAVSMPYFNYGGPLAQNNAAEEALLTHAATLSESLGCEHMEIRETNLRSDWKSTQRKVSMILPLPASDERLDKQLGSKLRAQVKKAESNELSIQFGGTELLDSYYQVFSRNMRDLGTPVYGKKLFSDILTNFPDKALLAVVKQDNTPLAAGFLLGHKDKLEIPWASSVRSKNHLGANMFMYRQILREAIARGYHYFDFGRSTRDASTHRFKKQWGAKEHQLHWHYWTRSGEHTPDLNPDNPKFKLAIMVWQRLPVFVTRIIGPPLARNLP